MRRALILLSFSIILLVAAAHVYRDPRVRDLFRTVPKTSPGSREVKQPASRSALQPANRRQEPPPAGAAVPGSPLSSRSSEAERATSNQVPNEAVSRVLLQILAAKGLARGIALEVSDEDVKVFGTVESDVQRGKIIELIEKGRESRRLDATALIVQR